MSAPTGQPTWVRWVQPPTWRGFKAAPRLSAADGELCLNVLTALQDRYHIIDWILLAKRQASVPAFMCWLGWISHPGAVYTGVARLTEAAGRRPAACLPGVLCDLSRLCLVSTVTCSPFCSDSELFRHKGIRENCSCWRNSAERFHYRQEEKKDKLKNLMMDCKNGEKVKEKVKITPKYRGSKGPSPSVSLGWQMGRLVTTPDVFHL